MWIAWVVYGSLDQPTGGYVYDRMIVEGLTRAGDQVKVLSLQPGAGGSELEDPLARQRPDVVVIDALCIPDVATRLNARRQGALVLLVHHLGSWEMEARPSERLLAAEAECLARCPTVVTTSQATAARLGAEAGVRCTVVPPGADRLPQAARPARRSAPLRLLMVGSLIPRKRVLDVLAALEACGTDAFELRLVGDPTRDCAYAARVQQTILGSPRLAARVHCCGVMGDDELVRELAHADFLVLASSLEGYGMVLSEARHAGLPILVARTAALSEVVGAGDDTLVFDGPAHLARTVAELAQNTTRRAKHQAAAWACAAKAPAWSDAVCTFRAVLERVVTTRSEPALPPRCASAP